MWESCREIRIKSYKRRCYKLDEEIIWDVFKEGCNISGNKSMGIRSKECVILFRCKDKYRW